MTAVRAVVAHALRAAAQHNADATVPPVAVFWPDPDRVWEPVIWDLKEAVPILVLGDYEPAKAQGPAIWLRAVLAAPDKVGLPAYLAEHDARNPWVIYLPGIARSELTDAANLDAALAPLLDVALRSVWWPSAHGQVPWTPHSFLGSKHGVGLDLGGDVKAKSALTSVLERLLAEDVKELKRMGRLDAARLHSLVITDGVRTLLHWLDEPDATASSLGRAQWDAFVETCRTTYSFDPAKDGPLTAAGRLGARQGTWSEVWDRFADSPQRYPDIPALLDKARPGGALFGDTDPHPDSWPSWNKEQEDDLRKALTALAANPDRGQVRAKLKELAAVHVRREESVWGELGLAPLAQATGCVAELADLTSVGAASGELSGMAEWYASDGCKIDDLAVRALASATSAADRSAVCAALHAVYDPWLDETARAFQAAATGYSGQVGLDVQPGTCVVFVDALRFDLAHRLARKLAPLSLTMKHRLAAFPTVTPTGQPAVAPVTAKWQAGPAFDAADDQGRSVKGQVLRHALADAGVQFLDWRQAETGDPGGIGWTQSNTIDSLGHDHGHDLSQVLDQQLDLVAERVQGLLAAGWRSVTVVTDHGFMLPAAAATKVTLPLALTEGDTARKPRVARLKAGAIRPDFQALPWTWDTSIEMVTAPGAAAFEAGTFYEHGGLSLQECVIPVLDIAADAGTTSGATTIAQIEAIRWTGQRCRIDFAPPDTEIVAEVRLAPGDSASAVGGPKQPSDPGEIKVLVDEDKAAEGTTAYVVLLAPDGAVLAQRKTTVGGAE
jgi:hypothetical protein